MLSGLGRIRYFFPSAVFFGDEREMSSIIEGDADDHRQWLVNEKYAPAIISKEIRFARQIFKSVARKQLI